MAVLISSSCGVSLFFIIIIKKNFFLAVQHVGSQVPHQGWNPHSPALEPWNLNHCTTREVPGMSLTDSEGAVRVQVPAQEPTS